MPSGYTTTTTALTQDDGEIISCTITQSASSGPDKTMSAKVVWVE
jgi:hypothetical protein